MTIFLNMAVIFLRNLNKSDLSKQDLKSLREKLLAPINKQQEATPKKKKD